MPVNLALGDGDTRAREGVATQFDAELHALPQLCLAGCLAEKTKGSARFRLSLCL